MGYKDNANDKKFVKLRSVVDDDSEEYAPAAQVPLAPAPPAQGTITPTLIDIMGVLTLMREDFERFQGEVRSQFDTLAS